MYKSPIEIIYGQMQTQVENGIYETIQKYDINVDKEELIKALQYDRDQYEMGYKARDEEIVRCKDCKYCGKSDTRGYGVCRCMTNPNYVNFDHFCSYGDWNDEEYEYEEYLVAPESVSEFTGLIDKSGKRIFESDICRFREWSKGNMCWIGEVHYEHQQFVISGNPNEECESPYTLVMSRFVPENIEVIGNIHDNPELLKGGEAE